MFQTPHSIVNIDGRLSPPEDAKISVFDRGFLFGDSIYEVTRSYDGVLFLLDEHLDRLWHSAERLSMKLPWSKSELKKEIERTVAETKLSNVYVRFIVTRGEGEIGMDPAYAGKCHLVIIVKPQAENPSWWYERGVSMAITGILRNSCRALDPNIKSGNYLNNILAYTEAKQKGSWDAIMLNSQGFVTEATVSNIWIVKKDEFITPPLTAGILAGITRKTLMEIAGKHGLKVIERDFTADELHSADECFLSSATREVVPIVTVDDKPVGNGKPGAHTMALLKLYREFISEYRRQRSSF
jgi:branched-chain amino acid aminotransferase